MVNYELGKIYKIVCDTTGLIYVGSTCETLSRRLAAHDRCYRSYLTRGIGYTSSFQLLENNNYHIILLELYPCTCTDELRARERFYIETIDCVNKNIPGRTKSEYDATHLAQKRQRYQNHRDKRRALARGYYHKKLRLLKLQKFQAIIDSIPYLNLSKNMKDHLV